MKLYTKKVGMLLLGTCLLSSDFCYATSGGAGSGRGPEHLLAELAPHRGGGKSVDFTIPSGSPDSTIAVSAKDGLSLHHDGVGRGWDLAEYTVGGARLAVAARQEVLDSGTFIQGVQDKHAASTAASSKPEVSEAYNLLNLYMNGGEGFLDMRDALDDFSNGTILRKLAALSDRVTKAQSHYEHDVLLVQAISLFPALFEHIRSIATTPDFAREMREDLGNIIPKLDRVVNILDTHIDKAGIREQLFDPSDLATKTHVAVERILITDIHDVTLQLERIFNRLSKPDMMADFREKLEGFEQSLQFSAKNTDGHTPTDKIKAAQKALTDYADLIACQNLFHEKESTIKTHLLFADFKKGVTRLNVLVEGIVDYMKDVHDVGFKAALDTGAVHDMTGGTLLLEGGGGAGAAASPESKIDRGLVERRAGTSRGRLDYPEQLRERIQAANNYLTETAPQ